MGPGRRRPPGPRQANDRPQRRGLAHQGAGRDLGQGRGNRGPAGRPQRTVSGIRRRPGRPRRAGKRPLQILHQPRPASVPERRARGAAAPGFGIETARRCRHHRLPQRRKIYPDFQNLSRPAQNRGLPVHHVDSPIGRGGDGRLLFLRGRRYSGVDRRRPPGQGVGHPVFKTYRTHPPALAFARFFQRPGSPERLPHASKRARVFQPGPVRQAADPGPHQNGRSPGPGTVFGAGKPIETVEPGRGSHFFRDRGRGAGIIVGH